jgi:hypothetical protein
MTNFELQMTNFKNSQFNKLILSCLLVLMSCISYSQVKASLDSTSIKIGAQVTYKIEVDTDTTSLVIFPEGQSFSPMEMIESYTIDTTKKDNRYNLIKKYGLTQFDSGAYTIPKQKILIGSKAIYTDSLKVEIREIAIDTTKQGLYDIKPIIEVDKSAGNWWKYLLLVILIIALVGFLLWWFIWRIKPLTKEEEIALLPPYDRAKLALKQLDESNYLQNENLKGYYSDLTFIIRKYLDEKVYDHALESTTDELISRLNLLKDGNQIELSKEDIRNIETILKRADLVKFAKGAPDVALAEIDRNTIDLEIDHVKEALPEPTEEEKLLDKQYKEEQERRNKTKKIVLTVGIVAFLLVGTIVGFGYKYGFSYVKDTILGHESKELLEGEWVTSAYGFPPITIATPKVLKRIEIPLADGQENQLKSSSFSYGTMLDVFNVTVNTVQFPKQAQNPGVEDQEKAPQIDLAALSEKAMQGMEAQGAKNIVALKEKFETPNGAEGLKSYGTMNIPSVGSDKLRAANFNFLLFTAENVLQQVVIISSQDDAYADQMVERILNSIELNPKTE